MSNKLNVTSWADRFAIMDHFKPGATQSCSLFNVTPDELTTAQELRAAGTSNSCMGRNCCCCFITEAAAPETVAPIRCTVPPPKPRLL